MIKKALIIAAGAGSRLNSAEKDIPKPLRVVAGLPLIKRIIMLAKKAGISEVVIVVGYEKDRIINTLQQENLGVKLQFVENPDWQKPNGLSVLAAKPYLQENFVLLMSDHIFDFNTLAALRQVPMGVQKAVLAVDYKLKSVFDMDDATKVIVQNNRIQKIGKTIDNYNAVDTGMFLVTPALFDALEEVKNERGCSLSDGIQLLANRGEMGAFDIGGAYWQDVDTKPSLLHAEKILLEACRKSTDGMISRHLNRHVSLFMTRFLIKTPLTANQMTGVTTLVGILSAVLTARGDYWSTVWGGFLFQMTSIMDGCDGEMSKLKYTNSKLGQWLDTISDNATYLFYIIGVVVGLSRTGTPHIAFLGTGALFGLCMTLFFMFYYLIRYTDSGSLVSIQKDFQEDKSGGKWKKVFAQLQFMIKRDFFALFFFVLALLGQMKLILYLVFAGSNITWIVLLSSKAGLFKNASKGALTH